MANILIIDDHKIFLDALASYVTSRGHHVETAVNGKEGLKVLQDYGPDLIILDINMPMMNGISFVEQLRKTGHPAKVIVLTQYDEPSLMIHMLSRGVNGFLLKNCDVSELEVAIKETLEAGEYCSPMISDLIKTYNQSPDVFANLELSDREKELLMHIVNGSSSKQITAEMNLTQFTVESYRKSIMQKTQAKNVASLVNIAARCGLMNT